METEKEEKKVIGKYKYKDGEKSLDVNCDCGVVLKIPERVIVSYIIAYIPCDACGHVHVIKRKKGKQ